MRKCGALFKHPDPPGLVDPFFLLHHFLRPTARFLKMPRNSADFADAPYSFTSASTIEHCPSCRAAQPDIAAARVRVAAAVFFARQLRLEVAEIATLLGVPLPDEGF